MSELDELRAAIEALEAQRTVLQLAVGFLGHWYGQRDELEQAAEYLDRSLSLAAEFDSFEFVPLFQAYRAEAVSRAERAVEQAKETRQQGSEAEAHRVLGWARHYAQPDAREPAEQELRTALELHRKTGATVHVARTLYQMAVYLRLVGDEAGAARAEAKASATARKQRLDWLPTPTPKATAAAGQ